MAEGPVIEPDFALQYRRLFETTWTDEAPVDSVRFVVLDCETTGLNPSADRIVTIGAVGVINGEILIQDSFEALLRVSENSPSVTVHGVTRDESRDGLEEPAALQMLVNYLADGVLVGHHIGHDIAMLDAGCERHWGFRLSNRCVDTMYLALHLQKAGAFSDRPPMRRFTLDALCELFGIAPHGRHTAAGDAFLTAEVFLRLRVLARRYGRTTLGRLSEPFEES